MTYSLIHNGTLIDGSGQQPVANAGVLIEGNEIRSVGPLDTLALPDGEVTKVDAQGGYIMPGFIDTHVHVMIEGVDTARTMATPFSLNFYNAIGYLRRTLEAGVTSVRDGCGADLGVKQAVEQGLILGPRLQISITALTITGGHVDVTTRSGIDFEAFVSASYTGHPSGRCDGVEEVRKKVREVLRAGADVIKVCSSGGVMSPTDHPEFTQFTPEELSVMVQECAYRRGVKVMAHAQGTQGIKNAVRAGIHSIEHGVYLDDEAIELMLEHGTYLVPTLLVGVAVLEIAEITKTIPEWALVKAREVVEIHRESISKAYKAGVRIAMGTDSGVMAHGTNLRELGLMCGIGMTPMEAIVATTKTAAECLGWQDRVGTVEPAKLADIVISKADPLADIRSLENVDNIAVVMKDGQTVKDRRS
jgi:imidazolonepropionase-like amidohydrolase